MRRLSIRAQARRELVEAVDWYENRRPGLGVRFIEAFRDAADRIAENANRYQVFSGALRRAPLHGFPYSLIYTVMDETVVILACFHGSRDSRRWHKSE